jgi:hypothetical protein
MCHKAAKGTAPTQDQVAELRQLSQDEHCSGEVRFLATLLTDCFGNVTLAAPPTAPGFALRLGCFVCGER